MESFEVGDIVVCIEAAHTVGLVLGGLYKVVVASTLRGVWVHHMPTRGFYKKRFRKVSDITDLEKAIYGIK